MTEESDPPIWSRPNVRMAVAHLWATLRTFSGLMDVFGMVVVGFVLAQIPSLERITGQPWYTPAAVGAGTLFFVLLTALRATARIGQLERAEADRQATHIRKMFSLQGDFNDLFEQVKEMANRKRTELRTIPANWGEGFELVSNIISDVNTRVLHLNARPAQQGDTGLLRDISTLCIRGVEKIESMKPRWT